jgi:hypothetical protein
MLSCPDKRKEKPVKTVIIRSRMKAIEAILINDSLNGQVSGQYPASKIDI